MKKTEQKVLNFIDEKKLIEKNDKILVALSGGPDSVFLLYFLKKYSNRFKVSVEAVHINHLLRGKDAYEDEKFCRELCKKLDIPYHLIRRKVRLYAAGKKISIEEAGRLVRYNEFEKLSLKEGFTKTATAHNCDDNAETVLLNLIKGAGLKGIAGIPVRREKIIRPVLILTKDEILSYLDFHKLKYRTDQSNVDDKYERNFLRNQIIPLLKKRLNPSLSNTLLKSSEVFVKINRIITKGVEKFSENLISQRDNLFILSLDELKIIDEEFGSEIIRNIFEKGPGIKISFNDCSRIMSLINKQTGKSIYLPDKTLVIKERNELIIKKPGSDKEFKPLVIRTGDTVKINSWKLSVKEVKKVSAGFGSNRNIEYIDGDYSGKNFIVRRWKPGDRFIPFGMKGSKKVSDFLNEQKIPSFNKKEQMILQNDDNRIIWIVGLRLDERFRVSSSTRRILKLCLS